jgi:hypothetical protein
LDLLPSTSSIVSIKRLKSFNVDRFPWKLIIAVVLIAFTSMQVMLVIEQTGQYQRAVEAIWYKNFLMADDEYNEEFSRQRNFFKYSEMKTWMTQSSENYYSLVDPNSEGFEYYEPL